MDEILQIAIKTVAFILMTLVGTDCSVEGLRNSLKRPGLTAFVGFGQFLIVPLLMFVSCQTLGASAEVTAGLMLIACCPAGIISNTYCYLIRGNTPLSVNLTAVSNLAAIVLTPIALTAVYAMISSQLGELRFIPAGLMARELIMMMLLPLLLGASVRAKRPEWIARNQSQLRATAMISMVTLLLLVIGTGIKQIVTHLQEIALLTCLSTALLFLTGWLISLVFRLNTADRWAVLLELPCRNLAIAAIIGITVLDRPELVRFSAAFFILQAAMILTLFTAVGRRKERGL